MKSAGHCAWTLAYKVWKSGSNPHYPFWSTEVFLREIVFNRRILYTDYNDVAVVVCKSHYMQLTASAPRCIYANVSTCRRRPVVHRWMLVARRRRLRTLEAGLASSWPRSPVPASVAQPHPSSDGYWQEHTSRHRKHVALINFSRSQSYV